MLFRKFTLTEHKNLLGFLCSAVRRSNRCPSQKGCWIALAFNSYIKIDFRKVYVLLWGQSYEK